MLTAGVDLAAQPGKTGAAAIDWAYRPPKVIYARLGVDDDSVLALARRVVLEGGRLGVDCPLGWPQDFVAFIRAHSEGLPLPLGAGSDTRSLRLRETDQALRERLGIIPLSVSTNMLGVTALRAARLLDRLRDEGTPVDRSGRGTICEVYPAASRTAWGLAKSMRDLSELLLDLPLQIGPSDRGLLESEHVFDALIAALTARAVALGATIGPSEQQDQLAAIEGWIHAPPLGQRLGSLR